MTDDQRWDQIWDMPVLQSQLVEKGMLFENAFVVNPLCCPSRSTILTGRYSHGTDVYKNAPPHGGFATFRGREGSTIATWLRGVGYRTALVGKYMNGYGARVSGHIPPGWDVWNVLVSLQDPASDYYRYRMSIDGRLVRFGPSEADYQTDVLGRHAADFVRSTPHERPLFLYFAPWAPHAPTQVPARYQNSLPDFVGIRPPNLNERDVSDKPGYVRSIPLSTTTGDAGRRRQLQALLPVDDALGEILTALGDGGRLQETLILFTSDNGLVARSHRWTGKQAPWEEGIRIPLIVRCDRLTSGRAAKDGHLVTNLDIAPTLAELAGAQAPGVDGMSLLPLLTRTATTWRSQFGIEYLSGGKDPPTYCGVRTERYKYVRYSTGEEELYDLTIDPYELRSQHDNPHFADVKKDLRENLIATCSPPPPGFTP